MGAVWRRPSNSRLPHPHNEPSFLATIFCCLHHTNSSPPPRPNIYLSPSNPFLAFVFLSLLLLLLLAVIPLCLGYLLLKHVHFNHLDLVPSSRHPACASYHLPAFSSYKPTLRPTRPGSLPFVFGSSLSKGRITA